MNISQLELYEKHRSRFEAYASLLLKWNQKINLTAITKPEEIKELHFLDSLSVVSKIVSRGTLLDIGPGAGFPGIPIKIVCPDLQVTLVDSVKKKCDFMKAVIRELRLDRIEVIQKTTTEKDPIGHFDVVVSRAAFKYSRLIQLALPNLAPGGVIIGMKGADVREEVYDSGPILKQYHLTPIKLINYSLTVSGQTRTLLMTGPG